MSKRVTQPFAVAALLALLVLGAPFRGPSRAQVPSPSFEKILHAFSSTPSDGGELYAGLLADKNGVFYGTTFEGGGGVCGCGTVFKLTPTSSGYVEEILYAFTGYAYGDGQQPQSTLIADAGGALYGTTAGGGNYGGSGCFDAGCGTVFMLTPTGSGYSERVLYRFKGGYDGSTPVAGVVMGSNGALYGTTLYNGGTRNCVNGCGTIYKLTPKRSGYVETILHHFQGTTDGGQPQAVLSITKSGVLFGTASIGGQIGAGCGGVGCGVVFKLKPPAPNHPHSGYVETVLYSFLAGNDGELPVGGLTADAAGAMYGTTVVGGGGPCGEGAGCGTVFKLAPEGGSYVESVLYRFMPPNRPDDGAFPHGGLVMDKSGALYSTTYAGGDRHCGCGTVFKLTPLPSGGYAETVLYIFHGTRDGAIPYTGLIIDKYGALYGTTSVGGGEGVCGRPGSSGCGVVFKVIP